MGDKEPKINLALSGDRIFQATPDNTTLYTFIGSTSIGDVIIDNSSINHVYVNLGENDTGGSTGLYIFRGMHPGYDKMAAFAAENRFPMVLNLRQVPNCDMEAYIAELDKSTAKFAANIPDFIPEK